MINDTCATTNTQTKSNVNPLEVTHSEPFWDVCVTTALKVDGNILVFVHPPKQPSIQIFTMEKCACHLVNAQMIVIVQVHRLVMYHLANLQVSAVVDNKLIIHTEPKIFLLIICVL
jgi:hypothetical protein